MSSILKALKKLEHEKNSRLQGTLRLNTDILTTVDSSRSHSPVAKALLLFLIFAGGGAATYYFMGDTKPPRTIAKSGPVIAAKAPQVKAPPAAIEPENLPAEIVVVPSRNEPSGEPPHIQRKKPAAADKKAGFIDKKPIGATIDGTSGRPDKADGTVQNELPAVAAVPALRVNGIAFQGNDADSVAIVNGVPVSNGSIIEGVTVEQVRKDRVLFQRNGEKFEIRLGQSNR